MRILKKMIAVFFKKCYFCNKNFTWKDKIIVNIDNKTFTHSGCLKNIKKKKAISFIEKVSDPLDESQFYG